MERGGGNVAEWSTVLREEIYLKKISQVRPPALANFKNNYRNLQLPFTKKVDTINKLFGAQKQGKGTLVSLFQHYHKILAGRH